MRTIKEMPERSARVRRDRSVCRLWALSPLSLRQLFSDQMSYFERLRAEMKGLGALLGIAILGG